jgi:hypothetical protein
VARPHLYSALLSASLLLNPAANAIADADYRLSRLHSNPAALLLEQAPPVTTAELDGYVFFNDSDRLLDSLRKAHEEGLILQGSSRGVLIVPGDETALAEQLSSMGNEVTSFSAGGHTVFSTSSPAWQVLGGSEFRGTGRFDYDEQDANRLRFATLLSQFSFGELQSAMQVAAIWHNYLGLNYRFKLDDWDNTQFAITGKLQNTSLIERSIKISEYEESQLFDQSRDVNHHLQANIDLGVSHQVSNWTFGLRLRDLYQQAMRSNDGSRYQQRSHISSQIDYRDSWGSVQLSVDLSPQVGFAEVKKRKRYALATELPVSEKFSISANYQWLDTAHDKDIRSLGLNYQLGQLLRIESQFSYAGDRELGGAISLQLPL